jgi:signal transduction histidine kinase
MRGRTATIHHSKQPVPETEALTSDPVRPVHEALWPLLETLELDELTCIVVFDPAGRRIHAAGALADVLGCEANKLPLTFHAMHAPREATSWSMQAEVQPDLEALIAQERAQSRLTVRTASRRWSVLCRWRALSIDQQTIALIGTYKPAPTPLRSDLLTRWPQTGLLRFDGEGRLLWLDDHAQSLLGLQIGQQLPLTAHIALRVPDELSTLDASCPISRAIDSPEERHAALLWLESASTPRLIHFDTRRVSSTGGVELLTSVQDVTETYFHIQRREEFLSIASHELRSPLTPLRGFVQMALDAHRQGEEVVGLLERADGQVRRMARMVDVLLDLSRVESGRMTQTRKPLALGALITRILDCWSTGSNAARLQLTDNSGDLIIHADELALEQVLVNLLENAVKFSPPNSPIQVRLEQRGAYALIMVEDHGPGMDAQVRARVFDRFFQGPSARREAGVGLGLYISRRIIEEHGGTIEVSGDNEHGTVVEIRLPLSEQAW